METKPAILILALAAILCGRASGAWNTYSNLVYATRPGFAANLTSLDIYTPTNAAQTGVPLKRVMIYVHGGGWYGGDKAGYILGVKPDAFTSRDWILVSINYRVTPQAVFPAHAEDVAAAFAWVHKNIASYGGDPDQIHVSGWSAGGHLAALVATDPRYLAANGLDLTMIRSVVNIDAAVYDLTTFAQTYGGTLPSIYGDTFGQDPAFWAFASPATYVSAGNLVNNLAPQLCFYSAGQDVASPNADNQNRARTFSKQLSLLGVMSEVDGDLTKTHDAINTSFGQGDWQAGP
jgi:arylformamidase